MINVVIILQNLQTIFLVRLFEFDFDFIVFKQQMIAATSDQISINSEDFGDNLEFGAISPTSFFWKYFFTSTSEEQRLWEKYSSIESMINSLSKNFDSELEHIYEMLSWSSSYSSKQDLMKLKSLLAKNAPFAKQYETSLPSSKEGTPPCP